MHGADRPVSQVALLSKEDFTDETSASAPLKAYLAASVLPNSMTSGTLSPLPDSAASRLVRWLPQVCHWMLMSAPVLALKAAVALLMIAIHCGLSLGSETSQTFSFTPVARSWARSASRCRSR